MLGKNKIEFLGAKEKIALDLRFDKIQNLPQQTSR